MDDLRKEIKEAADKFIEGHPHPKMARKAFIEGARAVGAIMNRAMLSATFSVGCMYDEQDWESYQKQKALT